jgi:hypothetical protein
MPLDHYSSCPGGTGKKIKFCCSDLLPELEKIERMVEGEQYIACLDHVNALNAKTPGRPCLLAWKLTLEQITGQREKAAATLASFIAQHPNNPIALAETALDRVQHGEVRAGIDLLQQAIELSGDSMHERVYTAIGAMAELLILTQHIAAARGHLFLQTMLSGGRDERALSLLMRLETTPTVPLLLKDAPVFEEPPADASWAGEFREALQLAARGWWRAAEARWNRLSAEADNAPAIWKNLAIVRGYLADYAGAIAAYRKYATLSVPLDDAVEAEAMAQLLDRDRAEGIIESLLVTFQVANMEELETRLAASRQFDRAEIDPRAFAEANEPPPVVNGAPEIPRNEIPQILGQVLLYGKQTDREARLELDVHRPHLEQARQVLTRFAADALGPQVSEEVTGHISAVQLALSWQWRLPADVTEAHRKALMREQRRELVLERWPRLPLPLLDRKTPEQVAADPAYRIRLLGAILLLEVSEANSAASNAYNELRGKLNLPLPEPIDPSTIDIDKLSLARFSRLIVEKLTDQQLIVAFQRMMLVRYEPAMRRLANEALRRENLKPEIRLAALQFLVSVEEDSNRALELINTGRDLAINLKQSTAGWDLDELAMRIQRLEGHEAARLIQKIQQQHGREPGVAEALFTMLARLGMLTPDGTIRIPTAAASTAGPSIVAPGAEPSKSAIWTPETGAPPLAAGSTKKSGLWVPE